MTSPATGAAGGVVQSIVQSLVTAVTQPLTQAASTFSTKVAEALAAQVGQMTTQFQQAHPAIAAVNAQIVGVTGTVAQSAGSIANANTSVVDMIRSSRTLKQEITRTITSLRQLPIIQRIIALSTRAWAAAQRVLNLVMRLNPIGLIITGIMLLVGAFVLAYQRSATFRTIVQAVFNSIRNVVVTAFNVIRTAVMVVWPFIMRVIQIAVGFIRSYITTYFTVIRVIVTTVWNAIRTVISSVWQGIVTAVRTYINIIRTVITTVFSAVRAVVSAVWNGIRAVITGAVRAVVTVIQGIRRVYAIVRDAFNQARNAVSSAIGGIVGFVASLPGRVVRALGNIASTLYSKGVDLIQGFINGIRSIADRVISAIKNFILDKIPDVVKRGLGMNSPSRLMAGLGRNIGEGLALGIENSSDLVADAMQQLVPVPTAAGVRGPAIDLARGAIGSATTRSVRLAAVDTARTRQPVTVNVYPQRGQSEYEIGLIAAREVAWAAKH